MVGKSKGPILKFINIGPDLTKNPMVMGDTGVYRL
jgi:hypothetical protein